MIFKKMGYLAACFLFAASIGGTTYAQDRNRVVKTVSSRPINQPPAPSSQATTTLSSSAPVRNSSSRPTLTNEIKVVQPLVKKTGDTDPLNAMGKAAASRSLYSSVVTGGMMNKIKSMIGIPYLYGATGPNRYDCSGFVWAVFQEVGIDFERTSARSMWQTYEPVTGDERYKFGTLVFFNRLGHVGIVADSEGFYHASSSKGITYSKFEGYWEKRIVGFRRIPMTVKAPETTLPVPPAAPAAAKVVE